MEVLKENLEIARKWQPLTEEERNRLLERVAVSAKDGRLEEYKTRW